jgi:glycosyltransferase involved in cell wall biosynthesis
MGRGSDAFVARVRAQHPAIAARVAATGAISSGDLAAALRACDVVVQPYPDGVTTRRTSVMAALANGAAIVTTTGALTEPVWSEREAVALIPAGQPQALVDAVIRLLRDPGERGRLARVGQQTYDAEFALDRTLDVLLQVRPEPACA